MTWHPIWIIISWYDILLKRKREFIPIDIRLDDTWYCLQARVISASVLVRLLVRKGTCNIKHRLWNVRRLPEIFTLLFSISEYNHLLFFFTENKDSTNYENPTFYCPMFASQCDVIFYCIFFSLCKFCTDLKKMLDFIQHFFLLFIFFLKRNNHFWRYHKRKKLFDVNSKKERRVSCFTPN